MEATAVALRKRSSANLHKDQLGACVHACEREDAEFSVRHFAKDFAAPMDVSNSSGFAMSRWHRMEPCCATACTQACITHALSACLALADCVLRVWSTCCMLGVFVDGRSDISFLQSGGLAEQVPRTGRRSSSCWQKDGGNVA